MVAEQLQFFASLDFPGRSTVLVREIAERLGVSERHLFGEIDTGALVVLDLRASGTARRCARVPVECYRDYVIRRLSGPLAHSADLLRRLPRSVRLALIRELQASLSTHE
jgi:hypothetical protein